MIRLITRVSVIICLVGCQSPPAVRDTGALVSKLAAQMDESVGAYVAALNRERDADDDRLREDLSAAARTAAVNADEFAIWNLAAGKRADNVAKTLELIHSSSRIDPRPPAGTSSRPSGDGQHRAASLAFDDAPLRTIGDVAGRIAKPASAAEQLSIISAFAKQVQTDLKAGAAPPAAAP